MMKKIIAFLAGIQIVTAGYCLGPNDIDLEYLSQTKPGCRHVHIKDKAGKIIEVVTVDDLEANWEIASEALRAAREKHKVR